MRFQLTASAPVDALHMHLCCDVDVVYVLYHQQSSLKNTFHARTWAHSVEQG